MRNARSSTSERREKGSPGSASEHPGVVPQRRSRYVGRFDREDYELVDLINEHLAQPALPGHIGALFDVTLHPRGIKEMTAPRDMRVAFAVMHLLDSLEAGRAEERLGALRALRDEVSGRAQSTLPRNAARVLVQIMKELLRTRHDRGRQLELAHEFRTASAGNPRHIRRLLARHYLLEMPEDWNQLAFDDHVHDAHTKGRKSPSHLILDAWIKGIRRLTVVYYHYVPAAAAAELLEAAATMGVNVRVGVEFQVRSRDRFVYLMWIPRGFLGAEDFQAFLGEARVRALFAEGLEVAAWQRQYVLATLDAFNLRHRQTLSTDLGIEIPPLSPEAFAESVGDGQASLLHLGEFIEAQLLPRFEARLAELRASAAATTELRLDLEHQMAAMRELDAEGVVERFLRPETNPELPDPGRPEHGPGAPVLSSISPRELVERLNALPSGYRLTLNCSGLDADDVLELVHECAGRITHLEVFNLKDHAAGRAEASAEIDRLRLAIVDPNPRPLKRLLHERIEHAKALGETERAARLEHVLHGLIELRKHYAHTPLKACLGSDSTGRSHRFPGMGLTVLETLPRRTRRVIDRGGPGRRRLPVQAQVHSYRVWPPVRELLLGKSSTLTRRRQVEDWSEPRGPRRGWVLDEVSLIDGMGNLATLGGFRESDLEKVTLQPAPLRPPRFVWRNLPTGWKNVLKVLLGFLPAFATFALTKDWWLLAFLGAPIWFVITGLRNALQSVLGGCGLHRGLLLWRDHINLSRLAESLMFTGFSVPLLDYLIKTLLLDRAMGINTATSPALLYAAIALANGLYISTHNLLRELPREAVVGNFFRSLLAIPLAIGLSAALVPTLSFVGVTDPLTELQAWAAVITKLASDLVAGVIEGLADRRHNIRQRLADYGTKLRDFFEAFNRLELLLPGTDVLALLHSPKELLRTVREEAAGLEKTLILHTLDLLYFWMYQPRARTALRRVLRSLSADERHVVLHAGRLLTREREISGFLLHGAAGERFGRALAFYLSYAPAYMDDMERLERSLTSDPCRIP